jgi:hypothetical protein
VRFKENSISTAPTHADRLSGTKKNWNSLQAAVFHLNSTISGRSVKDGPPAPYFQLLLQKALSWSVGVFLGGYGRKGTT